MEIKRQFGIQIDKLTRSIENTVSGDSFKTEVLPDRKRGEGLEDKRLAF